VKLHVKRLYRPTVREALMAAKDELGPDVLVLSTELVPAQGWRGLIGQRVVRLTAAAERPPSRSERFGEPGPASRSERFGEAGALSEDRPGPTAGRTEPALDDVIAPAHLRRGYGEDLDSALIHVRATPVALAAALISEPAREVA
jgi:hypothetical protein